MLKILQARLQHYVNLEFQMFSLGLEKGDEPEIKLAIFAGTQRKQGNTRTTSASLTSPDCVDNNKVENS